MSNGRTSNEMKSRDDAAGLGSPGPELGPAARLVLAAFARIEDEVRAGRLAKLDRLRADLAAIATTIAEAKAATAPSNRAIRTVDVEALLNELEVRIDAMMEIVGATPAAPAVVAPESVPAISERKVPEPEPVAAAADVIEADEPPQAVADTAAADDSAAVEAVIERDRVPTVSNVVSQLNGTAEQPSDTGEAERANDATGDNGPSFTMLEAAVAALNAAGENEPQAAPASESHKVEESPTWPEIEPAPSLPLLEAADDQTPLTDSEPTTVATEPAFQDSEPAPAATAPTVAQPVAREPIMPEIDLLSSYAQMKAIPFLPPEVGTAVIFPPRPLPSEHPAAGPAAEPEALEPAMQEPEAQQLPAQEHDASHPVAAPDPVVAAQPEAAADESPASAAIQSEPVTEQPLDPEPADSLFELENDPAAFLFEPEAGAIEKEPAELPARPITSERLPAQEPDKESAPASAPAAPPAKVSAPVAAAFLTTLSAPARTVPTQPAPSQPQPARAPLHDPLAPLKSMSDEEKIALFS